jgi:anti-sigma-K factor RskA
VPEHSEHVSADDLALRALGEELTEVPETHLAGCSHCQSELDQLRAVVATARAVEPEDYPTAPPPAVWDAVVAELGLRTDGGDGRDELAARRSGWRRTAPLTAAAAILGIVVGAGGVLLLSDDSEPPTAAVTALARLEPLPERAGTGTASLRGSGSSRVLEVDVHGLTRADGFYEVWLLDADAKRLVSLGLLEGSRGSFPLPAAVDVGDFPVVDVSIEPVDGDPAHSGDSVVRGQLRS